MEKDVQEKLHQSEYNFFFKYKCVCFTCKSPCLNCSTKRTSISTDTYDFEKYLESLARKPKAPLKVKTIGTDTWDLESHFDFYKTRKGAVIQKNVATDCIDLNFRKLCKRKRTKKQVTDNFLDKTLTFSSDDPDRELWSLKNESKTWESLGEEVMLNSEENKENHAVVKNRSLDIKKEFADDSSSDDSDVDLMTSSKVAKCKKLARRYELTLAQTLKDSFKAFECCACGETFTKKYLGVLHLGNHVQNDTLQCLNCDASFHSLDLLKAHMKYSHNISETNQCDDRENDREENISINLESSGSEVKPFLNENFGSKPVDKGFQCVLCLNVNDMSIKFPSYKALYLHKRLKHGIGDSKRRSKVERRPRLKREFICLFCGKEFKSTKALNDHLPVHTGEKNYPCDICNKPYTTSANLQTHKRTHTGLKSFKCTLCDKAFQKKDALKVHFRKHSGERPFHCDLCPMRFSRNFILKNHRLRHFSEKTFICPVCGKAFTTRGELKKHEKSHKTDPGPRKPRKPAVKPTLDTENAVICDICGKVYSTKSNLRLHQLVHLGVKPFQCPVCQQSYARKHSMLTHMRKHTDERPFSCETCGMAFYRNHTLKTHRLRHTGERPHKCHMCDKSFTQSSSLSYHIKHHNSKEEKKKLNLPIEERTKGQKKKKLVSKKSKVKDDEKPQEKAMNAGINNESIGFSENSSLMVPTIKKEVLILDENLSLDDIKREGRPPEMYIKINELGLSKYSYSNTTKHVVSVPNKMKIQFRKYAESAKDDRVAVNLISSKGCLAKGSNLSVTDGLIAEEGRKDGKAAENVLPVGGEILNATFVSNDNGEVIPFGSLTLQSMNVENMMIGSIVKVEREENLDSQKGSMRGTRLTKMKYEAVSSVNGIKNDSKTNCSILGPKDTRIQQRIQLINSEPLSFHIQVPVSCSAVSDEGALSGIAPTETYYDSV